MLKLRFKIILLIITSSITFLSCKKNIEIDENGIYIKNGIKSEIVITKVTDNRIEKGDYSFPYVHSIKERVRLSIEGKGISTKYKYGIKTHLLEGKPFDYKDFLSFKTKNEFYKWSFEKPKSKSQVTKDIFPLTFEKNHWYSVRNIDYYGSTCYLLFYINEKGEFIYDDLMFVNLSPI